MLPASRLRARATRARARGYPLVRPSHHPPPGSVRVRAGGPAPAPAPEQDAGARRIQAFGREADPPDLRRRRVRVEDKGPIVAFHWRGAPDEEAARAVVDAIAKRAEEGGLR